MILTDADQLREALRVALAERDEARAERDHYKEQLRERAEALLDARAEVERLCMEVNLLSEAGRIVAERLREACAQEARFYVGLGWTGEHVAQQIRATPLVTDAKADGGAP